MLPAFKFKYIKNLYPTFWSHTGSLVRVLEEEIHKGGDSVELIVDDWLPRVTFDIIAKAGFGLDMNAVRDPGNPVIEAMSQVNSTSPEAQKHRMLGFFVPRWALWNWPSKRRWEIDHIVELIHQVALPGIQKRRGLYSSKKLTAAQMEDESIDLENIPDTDTVTTLLRSPYPFSDKELLAQSTTFLLAGQDTVSLATTWALYVLSENPKIQSELRDEIRTNIPSPGGYFADLEPCLLESLPLLYAVCNETLRLFSPIPRITRVNNDHSTIIQERAIPMGMTIVTSPWAIQRSKTIWGGDALEFKPDRYLKKDEVTGKIKFDITGGLVGDAALFGNIAFGAGETGCIGQRFGRAEFAALLAGLVGRLEWRPVGVTKKDVEVQWGIVTRPVDGMNLEVRKVEGW
jgi:cytochrome P450